MSKRSGDGEAFLLALLIGGPVALFNAFINLPIAAQVSISGVLVLICYWLWSTWSKRQRKRQREKQEYQQALLDFRWRMNMSPIEFERCCADYLGLKGWDAKTTKASGDQGADVVARKGTCLLVVQCKKYQKPVGNKAVQEVISARAYRGADAAAVVSNQTYTPAARDLAEKTGVYLLHFTDLRDIDRRLGLPQILRAAQGFRSRPFS